MPFVKDTTYRDMPFSSESPSPDDFHCFVSVKKLIEHMKYNRKTFRCRTIGVVACDYGRFVIHELDDQTARIRLSLAHSGRQPPFTAMPYAAQLFGVVHWKESVGPVILPNVLQSVPVAVAIRLRNTMQWMSKTHVANRADVEEVLNRNNYGLCPVAIGQPLQAVENMVD